MSTDNPTPLHNTGLIGAGLMEGTLDMRLTPPAHSLTLEQHNRLQRSKQNLPPLRSFKHTGAIPKGCNLHVVAIDFSTDKFNFSLDVDIIHAGEKSFGQKLKKYYLQIMDYASRLTEQELIDRKEFKVIHKKTEDGTAK